MPLEDRLTSSQALITIFLVWSMQFSKYPNAFTNFSEQIFRPTPPSTRTHLILGVLMHTSRCRGLLWSNFGVEKSCSEKVM